MDVKVIAGTNNVKVEMNVVEKTKFEYKKYYDTIPNLNLTDVLEDIKLRLECLPGGDAYKALVRQHPAFEQLTTKNVELYQMVSTLQDENAKLREENEKFRMVLFKTEVRLDGINKSIVT